MFTFFIVGIIVFVIKLAMLAFKAALGITRQQMLMRQSNY